MKNQHSFMLVMWGNNALINKNREIKPLFQSIENTRILGWNSGFQIILQHPNAIKVDDLPDHK